MIGLSICLIHQPKLITKKNIHDNGHYLACIRQQHCQLIKMDDEHTYIHVQLTISTEKHQDYKLYYELYSARTPVYIIVT